MKKDEFSFIGIAFPVSFGVLLLSFVLRTCGQEFNLNSLITFDHVLSIIGIVMLYGSIVVSFVIIIRYALSEESGNLRDIFKKRERIRVQETEEVKSVSEISGKNTD